MPILPTALRGAKWGAFFGLTCGIFYSVGGLFYDLLTIGLNGGTALAFGALIGMPALLAVPGFACGFVAALVSRAFRGQAAGPGR